MKRYLLALILTACSSTPAPEVVAPADLMARATQLAHELIIGNGHIDLPYRLEEGKVDGKVSEDPTQRTRTTSWPKTRPR